MVQDNQVVPKVGGVSADHRNLYHHGRDRSKIGQLEMVPYPTSRGNNAMNERSAQVAEAHRLAATWEPPT